MWWCFNCQYTFLGTLFIPKIFLMSLIILKYRTFLSIYLQIFDHGFVYSLKIRKWLWHNWFPQRICFPKTVTQSTNIYWSHRLATSRIIKRHWERFPRFATAGFVTASFSLALGRLCKGETLPGALKRHKLSLLSKIRRKSTIRITFFKYLTKMIPKRQIYLRNSLTPSIFLPFPHHNQTLTSSFNPKSSFIS